ncbi:MAG TPA: hypothetical protein VJB14_12350, partial [Planctomycetota bacterium]|nr:hypothetical protein [Planctomycetota bacterium]
TGLLPALTRQSISWRTVAPGRVEITVDLRNDGPEPTAPGELIIETAALGAFVPFTPVTRVAVGSLEPGGRRRVRTAVARAFLPGQGNFLPAMADSLRQMPGMTPQFLDLLQHAEWAGNVNVWFDRQPERAVEVHRALGLQVRAGKPVAIMVDLPLDRAGYRVDVRTSDPAWTAELATLTEAYHFLIVRPPDLPGAAAGVTVEATRLKDSRKVPVEFTFETVEGPGESLGCIRA